MPARLVGLLVGLISGLALAFGDFSDFLLVLVLGAIGFVAGRAVDGDLDLSRYLGGNRRE